MNCSYCAALAIPERLMRSNDLHIYIIFTFLLIVIGLPVYSDPISKSLKSSPWYDFQKKDYHKYTKDEIKIPEQKKRNPDSAIMPSTGMAWLAQNLMSIFIILVVSIVILALLYFFYKYFKDKTNEQFPVMNPGKIEHHNLPDNLLDKISLTDELSLPQLKNKINQAIFENQMETACIYIYLFVLIVLQFQNIIQIKKNYTAREYKNKFLSTIIQDRVFSENTIKKIVIQFEYALYKGKIEDPVAVRELWNEVQMEQSTSNQISKEPVQK